MFIVVEVLPQPQFAKVATADLLADAKVRSDHQDAGRRTDRVACGVHTAATTAGGATPASAAATPGRRRCSGTGNSTFSVHLGGGRSHAHSQRTRRRRSSFFCLYWQRVVVGGGGGLSCHGRLIRYCRLRGTTLYSIQ